MTKRALKLLTGTDYTPETAPAICALVEFAAQNSGIVSRNYYDPHDLKDGRKDAYFQGLRSFQAEQRSITADLKRFSDALHTACLERVNDQQVIAEAPHAFSGRLQWEAHKAIESRKTDPSKYGGTHKGGLVKREVEVWAWDYTIGQNFSTEYRKAAATVLEAAIRAVILSKPKQQRKVQSIAELKALNEANGGCWFGKSEMRFFGTRIESGIIRGKYFITSEQPPHGSRKYSLRTFDEQGDVETVGEFCSHATKQDAKNAVRELDDIAAGLNHPQQADIKIA